MNVSLPPGLDLISAGYSLQFKEKGATHEGVCWGTKESQIQRFQTLIAPVRDHFPDEKLSVNDLGCGYGALYEYLRDEPCFKGGQYFGYDICPEFIEVANLRYTDPRARFFHSHHALEQADFSLVSGTFNMKGPHPSEEWDLFVKQALKDLFNKTNVALSFNMLCPDHTHQHDWLFGAEPDDFYQFCRKGLSPKCELSLNPELDGFTIAVFR